ncbi:hypothetical protein SAMN05421819_2389 [Bryocella elongata]|uniref:Carrier domain-containing protein n=1 Tax=Bryocella elongata TaxID=863522 RepID=A0A1H5YM75_9BACT|nr:hypothetical protein [Bryocella elongata]SEG25241.1 hypothetical protein SAMN05421819_2389 [Bryocella elongata]
MATHNPFSLGIQEQAIPILAIILCIGLAYLLLRWVASRRHRALIREREGVDEASFARRMQEQGFDPVIARSTFRYLQEVQGIRFPVLPTDDLDVDLGLDSEDIKQTLSDLSSGLERRLNAALLHRPLVTVEDLVRLLQASPRAESSPGTEAVA